jgi:asparagine synthase (glutamine-hydrolysing)
MCGICGVLHLDGTPADAHIVDRMTDMLIHRGPDQGDVFIDGICGLGNRRLAIQDLSPAGALPMRSDTLTIAFNGEIYNHPTIKKTLEAEGVRYHSGSDTESILHLYRRDDLELLRSLRGMFAFALWDSAKSRLLIARDRLGEKPLYYYCDHKRFVFGSEIKAILAHPDVPRESALDASLLALYFGYGSIPAPMTSFKGIRVLPPGHYLDITPDKPIQPVAYWTPPHPAPEQELTAARKLEYINEVREALGEAVRQALISDVPLGAFLSGGLDSSLIVALMHRHSNTVVRTFSIGFEGDTSYDETPYAQQVADLLGTQHTTFTVAPKALELLPTLAWHHDQPFGDSSAIPTYLVSQLTRREVTVALTGDGGDELFAGYERFYAASLARGSGVPPALWGAIAKLLESFPEGTGYYNLVKRVRRFARGASLPPALAYFDWIRLFSPEQIADLIPNRPGDVAGAHFAALATTPEGVTLSALLDANMRTYLPDDLLVKTDRSSMAVSLETRAPFLDHWLVELAATIPANLKLNGSVTKYVLKRVARGLLPDSIIDRPKHGFGVPLGTWLRRDMRLVREVLLDKRTRERGLLNMAAVEKLIDDHADHYRDHGQRLWGLLTLEWWHRLFIDPPSFAKP